MTLTADEALAGLGIVIVLAIGCQVLAARLRLPAIVLLLPAGFIAGAITHDVNPNYLFGSTFEPLVSLAVGLILFEAGLRLRFARRGGGAVVVRLVTIGVLLTLAGVAVGAKLIFDLESGVCLLLGAILVVSGPTVVLPLLAFVRPTLAVREVLKWEGVLIDPLGALLGVAAFTAVKAGAAGNKPFHFGGFLTSITVGAAVGALAAAILWLLLRRVQARVPQLAISVTIMLVVGALVGADLLREDSGFVAVVVVGAALANQSSVDVSRIFDFHETVVTLLIGLLFVMISASVTPSQVNEVLGDSVALIAIMVIVLRPVVVAVSTWGSQLTGRERSFVAWMAPRGIVAAATASAFGLELTRAGVSGAEKILPIAFVVIFGTVMLYGLSAVPVARLLGVAGTGASTVLVVGGNPSALAISRALKTGGLRVRIWTGEPSQQEAARKAGLETGIVSIGAGLEAPEIEFEDVDVALLMTDSDYFNALAAYELRGELGSASVFRLAPEPSLAGIAPARAEGGILFGQSLTYPEFSRRVAAGARVETRADEVASDGAVPLFVCRKDGRLRVITAGAAPDLGEGERLIYLTPAAA